MDISGDNSFGGKAGRTPTNTFNGTITVTVNQVLEQQPARGGENRSPITGTGSSCFSGWLTAHTISGSNSVTSTQVADAHRVCRQRPSVKRSDGAGCSGSFLNVSPY